MTPQALIDQWRLHPDPEVGSCANQLAGWLRTQVTHDSRSGAEVAKAILANYPDELDKAACDHCEQCGEVVMCSFHSVLSMLQGHVPPDTHLSRMGEWRALVTGASRGGGDTRPPLEEEKAHGLR
jgi:hypothetical protein